MLVDRLFKVYKCCSDYADINLITPNPYFCLCIRIHEYLLKCLCPGLAHIQYFHVWAVSACYPPVLADPARFFACVHKSQLRCRSSIRHSWYMWAEVRPKNQACSVSGTIYTALNGRMILT